MKNTITRLSDSQIKFVITGSGQEVAPFFDRALERLSKEINIKGFRPGKVPVNVAREALGEHAIEHEAQELFIQDSYYEMVHSENITPVAQPTDIKITTFSSTEGAEWEGVVEVIPEIKTTDWRKIVSGRKPETPFDQIEANEEEVNQTIQELARNLAMSEDKEGVSEKGDWLKIDIDVSPESSLTDDQKEKIRAQGVGIILGDNRFIPGFEDHLVGVQAGDKKSFELSFPDNYFVRDLASLLVPFVISIVEVKKIVLPEINDDFAKKYGAQSIDILKSQIKENATSHKKQEAKELFENNLLSTLVEAIKIEAPKALIAQEQDMMLHRFQHNIEENQKIPFSDYLQAVKSSEEEIKKNFIDQAEKNVRIGLLLGQITKDEGVSISDDEIDAMMASDIMQRTLGQSPEKVSEIEKMIQDQYKNEEFLSSLKNSIRARKTMDLILESSGK